MPEKNKKSVTKRIKSKTTKKQLFGAFPWALVSPVKISGKTTNIKSDIIIKRKRRYYLGWPKPLNSCL
jgi:hypothetical protein